MYGRVHEPEAKVLRLDKTSEDFLHEGAQEHHGVQDVWAPQVWAWKKSQRHWHVSIKKKIKIIVIVLFITISVERTQHHQQQQTTNEQS